MMGRLLGASILLLLAVVAMGPSAALVRAEGLDPSFGSGGRVIAPLTFAGPARYRPEVPLALGADGSLYAGNGAVVRRIDPGGALDQGFGADGVLTPAAPAGGTFEVRGLAVDAAGRLVVAGTALGPAEEFDPPIELTGAVLPLAARVARYLPGGAPDPAFAAGGTLETDLGLAAPREEEGRPLLGRSWVELTGVAVDPQNRVILTGGAAAGSHYGCAHDWFWNSLTYAGFVARLTDAGALDPSFGAGGLFGGRSVRENPLGLEAVGHPLLGPEGEVIYRSDPGFHCPNQDGSDGIAELGEEGATHKEFGHSGAIRGSVIDTAFTADGGVVVLEMPRRRGRLRHRFWVSKLDRRGAPDPSFGTDGRVSVTIVGDGARDGFSSIAADPRGGVIVGGVATRRRGQAGPARGHWVLARLRPDGRPRRGFGENGRIEVSFGSGLLGAPSILIDSGDRVTLAGRYHRARQTGLAVVRYLLGRRSSRAPRRSARTRSRYSQTTASIRPASRSISSA